MENYNAVDETMMESALDDAAQAPDARADALSEALGTRVKVYNGRNKGTLEIEFYTLDDLKNIANTIAK